MNPEKTLGKITCQERNKARKARGREVGKKNTRKQANATLQSGMQ